MLPSLLVLVPPSEGKAPGGTRGRLPDGFAKALGEHRASVATHLGEAAASLDTAHAKKLFGATGFLLDRALECAAAVADGTAPLLPAHERFTGVVWGSLDPRTLDDEQRRAILVPNGLYGLVRGTDGIADFRLTMSARLEGVGTLSRFWRGPVTAQVGRLARSATVVDLLPAEHRAAVDGRRCAMAGEYVTVDFVRGDGHGAAGHVAKAVKGAFARALLDGGLGAVRRFRHEGWRAFAQDNAIVVVAP